MSPNDVVEVSDPQLGRMFCGEVAIGQIGDMTHVRLSRCGPGLFSRR